MRYQSQSIARSAAAAYPEFLKAKTIPMVDAGFEISLDEINPILLWHQKLIVQWAIRGGRRAVFAAFGLGKTVVQLEIVRIIIRKAGGHGLITMPLGIRQEFMQDAHMLQTGESPFVSDAQRAQLRAWIASDPTRTMPTPKFIRSITEAETDVFCLTNYETVREGKLNPKHYTVTCLDEAAVLRGFGGSKTFREFMRKYDMVPYRFVATATPSPNEYIELLAYSAYLGIMDVSHAKTRFFKRDSTKADKLTIHVHKEREFWLWVASWALFISKPSDICGCRNPETCKHDEGYNLPELKVVWHELNASAGDSGQERSGQRRIFSEPALGLTEAAREKRDSMVVRTREVVEIIKSHPDEEDNQVVIWCDLNKEQNLIERALRDEGLTITSLYGNQSIDIRDTLLQQWKQRSTRVFLSKPTMYGAGINMQQSHTMIFAGIGFKFADFIQAIHRCYRFMQQHTVTVHLIFTEAEWSVRKTLETKWKQHEEQRQKMSEIIREYGLTGLALAQEMQRAMGVERIEIKGENYTLVNNDCVPEMARMEDNSIDLVVTSIPFSTQYEYSPNFADFGHTDSNEHFFEQMDFLSPELLRVLKPGRVAAIHVKDRIVPSGLTDLGFQTVYPFHVDCILHYKRHGFAYMGMKTIVTDVVRENNQTYRLSYTEQCKDGTKMGFGMPEYLLLFRKPVTDTSNGYADDPVVKSKEDYSLARWQKDAHGFARSSGNRLMSAEEIRKLPHDIIYKLWKEFSLAEIYDYEHHVKIGELLERYEKLPTDFMLLPPHSTHPDVWTDVTRMRTLNGVQHAKGKEMHLCPMQFDIVDRAIVQWSMEGETVLDPFSGLGTVPLRAMMLRRKGYGIELNPKYFLDAKDYCKSYEEKQRSTLSLFDALEIDGSREPVGGSMLTRD